MWSTTMELYVEAVRSYFSDQEWTDMSFKDQHKFARYYYIYFSCLDLGIDVVIPTFMDIAANNILNSISCNYCNLLFTVESDKSQHEQICSKRKIEVVESATSAVPEYKCPKCTHKTKWKYSLKRHMAIHGAKTLKCTVCEYQCIRKSQLKVHMARHTGAMSFHCTKCEYKCVASATLFKHMNMHLTPFQCNLCDYKATSNIVLKRHMDKHEKEGLVVKRRLKADHKKYGPFKCNKCNVEFPRQDMLATHLQSPCPSSTLGTNLMKQESEVFVCDLCGFQTTRKKRYLQHNAAHKKKEPVKCNHCDYQCMRKDLLNSHLRTHFKGALYKCEMCNYESIFKGNIKRHVQRMHSQDSTIGMDESEAA